jgi:hypothetical protein
MSTTEDTSGGTKPPVSSSGKKNGVKVGVSVGSGVGVAVAVGVGVGGANPGSEQARLTITNARVKTKGIFLCVNSLLLVKTENLVYHTLR